MPAISFQNVSQDLSPAPRGDVQRARRRELRHRARRVLRPARPQRRRQDHADQHPGRPGARHAAAASRCWATTSSTDYAAARRSLGIVPQELVFDPFFSVRETLRIQSGYFGVRTTTPGSTSCCANLGLADKADANMRQLSGGMKRRVLVAQALVHRPPVIVLDEPTAGVDVELRQTLWQFVARLNKRGPHGAADHALPRRGRGAVRPHRDAQAGPRGGAGPHLGAAGRHAPARCCASRSTTPLPAALAAQARVTGRIVQVTAHDAAEVEPVLAALREAGVPARGPGDRPRRPGGRVPRDHAGRRRDRRWRHERRTARARARCSTRSAALLEGQLPDRGRAGAHRGAVPADLRPRARRPREGLRRRRLHQLPDPGPGDDERAAERLRQQQLAR